MRADLLALLALLARQRRARGLRLAARPGEPLLAQQTQPLQRRRLAQHNEQRQERGDCRDRGEDLDDH